jgi:hypothetical protein
MEKTTTKRERENDDGDMSTAKRSRVEFHQLHAVVFDKEGADFEEMVKDVYVGVPQKTIEAAIKAFIVDNAQTVENEETGEIVDRGEYIGLSKYLSSSFDGGVVGLEHKFKEWAHENGLEVEITHNKYEMSLAHANDALSVDEINQIN